MYETITTVRTTTYTETLSGKEFIVTIEAAKDNDKYYRRYYVRYEGQTLGWIIKHHGDREWSWYWSHMQTTGNVCGGWEETLAEAAWQIARKNASRLVHA